MIAFFRKIQFRVIELQGKHLLVKVITVINEKLTDVKEALRNGRLRFATKELRELKKTLGVVVNACENRVDEGEFVLSALLRKEWSD